MMCCCYCLVAKFCPTLQPHGLQQARLPFPPPAPGTCSNSCPLSWWCHPTISSSVVPFSSYLQSFPASRSFPMSSLFASDAQKVLELQFQHEFSSVQLLNHVRLFATPWIAARQASLSITNSVDMTLSKLQEIVEDRGAWCAVAWGWTQLSDRTAIIFTGCTLHEAQSHIPSTQHYT